MTQDKASQNRFDSLRLVMDGRELIQQEVEKLERRLSTNPAHLKSRLLLLGFYANGYYMDAVRGQKFSTHLLWLIENDPENPAHQHVMLIHPHEHFRAARKQYR